MKKNNLLDFLLVILLYIAISSFPFNLIFKNSDVLVSVFQIIVQVVYFIFVYLFITKKTNLILNNKSTAVSFLFFVPCLIACFSNYLYFAFCPNDFSPLFEKRVLLEIFLYLFVAINEEFIFRVLFINNTEIKSPFLIIIVSSLIFSFCHLTSFLSTFNPADLVIVGYTFLLGLALGTTYLFTKKHLFVISIHFLFNVMNKCVFESLTNNGISNVWYYLIANTIVSIILAIYLIVIYKINISKITLEETCNG